MRLQPIVNAIAATHKLIGRVPCATARYWGLMSPANILTEEFAQAAADAGLRARQRALASGHPVVFVDGLGRLVKEDPDGTKFEVRLQPGESRESHLQIVGELTAAT